eukprot:Amastigsp_a176390_40.p2 type:complete len:250 gc:universal Amastigsp_a176390_40:1037-1786(+)
MLDLAREQRRDAVLGVFPCSVLADRVVGVCDNGDEDVEQNERCHQHVREKVERRKVPVRRLELRVRERAEDRENERLCGARHGAEAFDVDRKHHPAGLGIGEEKNQKNHQKDGNVRRRAGQGLGEMIDTVDARKVLERLDPAEEHVERVDVELLRLEERNALEVDVARVRLERLPGEHRAEGDKGDDSKDCDDDEECVVEHVEVVPDIVDEIHPPAAGLCDASAVRVVASARLHHFHALFDDVRDDKER